MSRFIANFEHSRPTRNPVWLRAADGTLTVIDLPAPSDDDVATLVRTVCQKMTAVVERCQEALGEAEPPEHANRGCGGTHRYDTRSIPAGPSHDPQLALRTHRGPSYCSFVRDRSELNRMLVDAAGQGDLADMKKLIRAGAQVNEEGHGDLTPMWVAVSAGWADAVRLLLRAGADPNANFRGEPLLVHAAMGKPEIVDILLRSGADPRGMGTKGNALAALSPGHQDHAPGVAWLLLNAGVSPSARDSRKRTAIDRLLAQVTPKGRKLDRRVATAQLEVLRVLEPHAGKQRQLVTVAARELERRLGRSSNRAQTPGNVAVTDRQIRTALYEYGHKIAKGLNMSDVDVSKPASIRRAIAEIWDETSYTYSESFEAVLNKLVPDLGAQWSKLEKRLKLHSEFNHGLTDGMKAKMTKVATSKPKRQGKPKAKNRS